MRLLLFTQADGNGQVYTQRADKSADLKPDIMCEGSLSSERLQYSADLVQRVGATISSSTCEVHTRRGINSLLIHVYLHVNCWGHTCTNKCSLLYRTIR